MKHLLTGLTAAALITMALPAAHAQQPAPNTPVQSGSEGTMGASAKAAAQEPKEQGAQLKAPQSAGATSAVGRSLKNTAPAQN
jgi:hypothetical protein